MRQYTLPDIESIRDSATKSSCMHAKVLEEGPKDDPNLTAVTDCVDR